MAKGRLPDYSVFAVSGDGRNAQWTRLGAGWSTEDGKGITCQLNAHPIGNRIVLRNYEPPKDKSDDIPY